MEDPWDKVFGSYHDGTDEADDRIRQRRRAMYESKKKAASV